jgi:hypothetical protein
MNANRPILHAKFANNLADITRRCDSVSLDQPKPELRDSSVREFEAALIKARDAWRCRKLHFSRNTTFSDYRAQPR